MNLPPVQSVLTHGGRGAAGVYGILLLQSFLASGTHIVAKVIAMEMDPYVLTLVRSVIAGLTLVLVLLLRGASFRIRKADIPLMLFLSFLAVPINQFLFLWGMRYTIPSNASLLYATTPIFVLLFSRVFLKELLNRTKVVGMALGFIGVVIVVFERGVDASVQYLAGNALVFIAVLAWGLYTVFGKRMIGAYGALESSALTLIMGTIMFLPFGILPTMEFSFSSLTGANWLQIMYLGIVTSVFSYYLWYHALGRIEAGKVALFTNLQPILTTLLALLLLGQGVTLMFIVGGTVAVCGVAVAQFG